MERSNWLEAVLFDFDGTIVDTTELIYESMRRTTREVLGRELTRETLMANVGQPLPRQMELLADGRPEKTKELLEVYLHYNEELHEGLIREFPNVGASLACLRDSGLRLAVVTSKRRFSVEMALDSFPDLRDLFDVFVTMEDTTEHKPLPAPLLKGLELLGDVPPRKGRLRRRRPLRCRRRPRRWRRERRPELGCIHRRCPACCQPRSPFRRPRLRGGSSAESGRLTLAPSS